jgi:hypothetical protein
MDAMICQLNWKTLPGLRGLSCSEFRAAETAAPDNERGVAVTFADETERDTLLLELEAYFAQQRFSNNAAAFEAVKTHILEQMARKPQQATVAVPPPGAAKREQA